MGAVTIQQMADRVAALMEERLGLRGRSLADKLRRSGRVLPAAIRSEIGVIEEAARHAQNPKLKLRIDEARVARAFDLSVRHLSRIDASARRRNTWIGVANSIAISLFAVLVLTLGVLHWRGYF
ncbi:hypothetical protein L0V05_10355 [Tabrizicola sp. J26]|uniref:hypothetical protein n=1 Tax=Alitabrizicola rongguiensis TaxID=2909234 RepID=UPI001F4606A0|nr:hypothetical protein [Tabrizicola rongguiensis]MCF1709218.1 hypothetical protein [Tabrizicola rongguiensis]